MTAQWGMGVIWGVTAIICAANKGFVYPDFVGIVQGRPGIRLGVTTVGFDR